MSDAQVAMWLTISMVASFFFIGIAFVFVFISGQDMHILQKSGVCIVGFWLGCPGGANSPLFEIRLLSG